MSYITQNCNFNPFLLPIQTVTIWHEDEGQLTMGLLSIEVNENDQYHAIWKCEMVLFVRRLI